MLSCQQQNYLIIAGIDVGLQVIGWLISYCFQTEKIYDLTGKCWFYSCVLTILKQQKFSPYRFNFIR